MNVKVLISSSIFLLLSNGLASQSLSDINWILGEWKYTSSKYSNYESWNKKSDSLYWGINRRSVEGKMRPNEELRIYRRNDTILYSAKVFDQNDRQAIEFYATELSDSLMIFQNPGHDFPKRIQYQMINRDSLKVIIADDQKEFIFLFEKYSK